MIAAKDKITPGQLMILVIQSQIGVSVLFLPSTVESIARNDAWISVILAGGVTLLLITIMWALSRRFPAMTLFEYLPLLLGKFLGKIVHVIYAMLFILACSLIAVQFADVVRDWVFSSTPSWIILGLLLVTSLYMAQENIRLIARFFVLTFGVIFVLILIAAYAFRDADILYILPINQAGIPNIFKGMLKAMTSLFGFEILLFSYPYVQGGGKGILKATLFANLFSTLLYTFLVFTCLIVFSPEELKIIPQPVLYMVKALTFTVFERADLYILTIWTVVVISTVIAYLFMAAKSVSALFGKKRHKGTAPFVSIVIFIIALIPHNQDTTNILQNLVAIFASVSLAALPLILLCISVFLNIKGKEQAEV
ncbi:GerAB/ArcD/ProY family transporter [Cohnella silvisoli]|uniref:GerAB/ArcD/ProY family transporter n=1 Tax=Cohnella silvisoli TaxID=2873699 RepID=A0ABV1L005_9BACL|nr:GerAB/ArcD/ProY family transporter [Cohnella silvisoli]MCD9024976.1 spore germination protein [Cohnella silvisoli]